MPADDESCPACLLFFLHARGFSSQLDASIGLAGRNCLFLENFKLLKTDSCRMGTTIQTHRERERRGELHTPSTLRLEDPHSHQGRLIRLPSTIEYRPTTTTSPHLTSLSTLTNPNSNPNPVSPEGKFLDRTYAPPTPPHHPLPPLHMPLVRCILLPLPIPHSSPRNTPTPLLEATHTSIPDTQPTPTSFQPTPASLTSAQVHFIPLPAPP